MLCLVAMHADQLTVEIGTVRALVAEKFPACAGLPIVAVASQGTVNALFRIGASLIARLPLRPGNAAKTLGQLESEAATARELAGRTRFVHSGACRSRAAGSRLPAPLGGAEIAPWHLSHRS